YATGFRQLPSQIYEHEVIVYNPSILQVKDGTLISDDEIKDHSTDFKLDELAKHVVEGGATALVFVNHLMEGVDEARAYAWLPWMPTPVSTRDARVERDVREHWHDDFLKLTFLTEHEMRLPVRFKLKRKRDDKLEDIAENRPREEWMEAVPLFTNRNREVLGVSYRLGNGHLYVLPTFENNDEVIIDFLFKTIPQIYKVETRRALVDEYLSPAEQIAMETIEKLVAYKKEAEKRIEKSREDLVKAKLEKEQVVADDETAKLILGYYDVAQRQDKVALHYLYKIIDHLEEKYGGGTEAKKVLGGNEGWNTIHKIANASYGDMRHAPKPGEVVKPWSREEISACFEAAAGIISAYLETLFETPVGVTNEKTDD
ncbi:MAG: hypothetical protein ACYC48_02025, partial [Minisyncoccota bacterium]